MIRHQNFQMDSAYELLFFLSFFIYYNTHSITYIMCKHTVITPNIRYHTLCFSKCQYLPYLVISIDYKFYSKVNNKYYLTLVSFTNFLMFNINECYKKAGSACTTYKLKMADSVLNYLSMFFLLFMSYCCSQSICMFACLGLVIIQAIVDLQYLQAYVHVHIFVVFLIILHCPFSVLVCLYYVCFPATTIILFSIYRSLVYPIFPTFRVKLFTKTIPFTKKNVK